MSNKKCKWLQWVSIVLSVVAIVFSIVALCKCRGGSAFSDANYWGVIVGVLCFTVAAIVGVNIYNIIDFKENITMLRQHEKDIRWIYRNKENKKQEHAMGQTEPMPRKEDLSFE